MTYQFDSPKVGKHYRVGTTRLKILARVCQGPPPSFGELKVACGLKNNNAITMHVKALRKQGLVTWEKNLARTIRPTCRFIPVEELCPNQR